MSAWTICCAEPISKRPILKNNVTVGNERHPCVTSFPLITDYGDYIPLIIKIITPIIDLVNMGVLIMIRFDRLWKTMEEKKMTTYRLREQCGIDSKTIRRLKANDNMETKTLNKLCAVLQCKLEDIAEFVED